MVEARDPELERAIHEQPDDDQRFCVYADWLSTHGNPRGELALVQLARAAADTPALQAREAELLEQHADQIRGAHVTSNTRTFEDLAYVRYKGGFWRSLRAVTGSATQLAAMLGHPSAGLLHTLHVSHVDDCKDDFDAVVDALQRADPPLAGLRELRLGSWPETQSDVASFRQRSCSSLAQLAGACPRLEILRLWCPSFGMDDFPNLRWIDARGGVAGQSIAAIAAARLPKLEQLDLGLGWPKRALAKLLSGAATPALRRVRLWPRGRVDGLPIIDRIAASPLGHQLEQLELANWAEHRADVDGFYTS